jgi:hypothetical protein
VFISKALQLNLTVKIKYVEEQELNFIFANIAFDFLLRKITKLFSSLSKI